MSTGGSPVTVTSTVLEAAPSAGMTLTESDRLRILPEVGRLRAATTGQVVRLTGRSHQAIRHRLRKLEAAGYVERIPRAISHGVVSDCAWVLTKQGLEAVRYFCDLPPGAIPFSRAVGGWKPRYLHHAALTNDIRIAAEQSAAVSGIALKWLSEYELADPRATKRTDRFLLKFEYAGPAGAKLHHEPDGMVIVRALDAPKSEAVALAIEADRGGLTGQPVVTQNLLRRSSIRAKLLAARAHLAGDYKRFAPSFGLLFIIEAATDVRIDSIRAALREVPELAPRVFITRAALMSDENFFRGEIWTRHDGRRISLFNPEAGREDDHEENEVPLRVGPQPARGDATTAASL